MRRHLFRSAPAGAALPCLGQEPDVPGLSRQATIQWAGAEPALNGRALPSTLVFRFLFANGHR
jgi:hypothetical protein